MGIIERAWHLEPRDSSLWIHGDSADSREVGMPKARPQDAARRLNLHESIGFNHGLHEAMPGQC